MAAAKDDNAFIVLGHGTEEITEWEERPIIPKGYTLITVEKCGIYATTEEIYPLIEAFSKATNRDIFTNPVRHKKQIEKFMKDKGIHIYTEGKRYPNLTLQLFLDWPTDKYVNIIKSGVYPFPIDAESFQIGEGETFHNRLFKKIGPYKGLYSTLPEDYNAKIQFDGSEYPTVDEVSKLIETNRRTTVLKEKLSVPLEDIFKRCGPGVYYYVVCRSPKHIKSPEDLIESDVIPPESINKYTPYLIRNWSSKVSNIIPLLEDNIKSSKHWIKKELETTRNNYKKLNRVPLIRRLSITQQNNIKGGYKSRKNIHRNKYAKTKKNNKRA